MRKTVWGIMILVVLLVCASCGANTEFKTNAALQEELENNPREMASVVLTPPTPPPATPRSCEQHVPWYTASGDAGHYPSCRVCKEITGDLQPHVHGEYTTDVILLVDRVAYMKQYERCQVCSGIYHGRYIPYEAEGEEADP